MESQKLQKILDLFKIVDAEIEKLKHRVDSNELKMRSKLFVSKKKDEDLEDKTDNLIKDDGFNEMRDLRKSGVV